VINALKHAFPKDRPNGRVVVSYQINGSDWKLVVSDNGIGKPDVVANPAKGGLGTTLVKALAQDLDAKVEVVSGPGGVSVSLTHATLDSNPSCRTNKIKRLDRNSSQKHKAKIALGNT